MNMSHRMRVLVNSSVTSIKGLLAVELMEVLEKQCKKKRRKKWISDFHDRWDREGASVNLLNQFLTLDGSSFRNRLRIDVAKFEELLSRVSKTIQRFDTHMQSTLSAKTKLEVTLHYLATGDALVTLETIYRIPGSTISLFIADVCEAIIDALTEFIMVPTSEDEWEKIERGFRTKWNFPGCIGAIDGKHVFVRNRIRGDPNVNEMNKILLLALVDDDYCFNYIDFGCKESVADGSVLSNSVLARNLEQNTWHTPRNSVVVGNEAFPLEIYLMRPYPAREGLNLKRKIFNYRLMRARRVAENAFGILLKRFKIFEKPIVFSSLKVEKIVRAACALHNWLRKKDPDYITKSHIDVEDTDGGVVIPGQWRYEEPSQGLEDVEDLMEGDDYSTDAEQIREEYARFFVAEGAVPWQMNMIE